MFPEKKSFLGTLLSLDERNALERTQELSCFAPFIISVKKKLSEQSQISNCYICALNP